MFTFIETNFIFLKGIKAKAKGIKAKGIKATRQRGSEEAFPRRLAACSLVLTTTAASNYWHAN
jgi:hypothetical protein